MDRSAEVVEHIILNVRRGQGEDFERSFSQAKELISASPGFIDLALHRCIETDDRYLLLVRWESIEDHMVGFRNSEAFQQWRAMLHHFYDPPPTVEHYSVISTA